jgi:DNA-binding NarL/FixJ family response regulator
MHALLIDDHLLFSHSLRYLLEDLDPTLVCASAASIAEAVVCPGPFDFILLDVALPDSEGTSGLVRVRQAHEGASVVMLSGDERPELIHALVEAGAAGFVPKSSDVDTLLQALRTMLAGGVYLPPFALGARMACPPAPPAGSVGRHPDSAPELPGAMQLPPRQLDCLLRLVQGKPNKVIARELNLSDHTVKSHLSGAFRALGVSNRTEAVFKAARLGLLPASPPGSSGTA